MVCEGCDINYSADDVAGLCIQFKCVQIKNWLYHVCLFPDMHKSFVLGFRQYGPNERIPKAGGSFQLQINSCLQITPQNLVDKLKLILLFS
jgi:hypothetical protein